MKVVWEKLDYAIYTTLLNILENVVPMQYRQSTKKVKVCTLF